MDTLELPMSVSPMTIFMHLFVSAFAHHGLTIRTPVVFTCVFTCVCEHMSMDDGLEAASGIVDISDDVFLILVEHGVTRPDPPVSPRPPFLALRLVVPRVQGHVIQTLDATKISYQSMRLHCCQQWVQEQRASSLRCAGNGSIGPRFVSVLPTEPMCHTPSSESRSMRFN